MHRRLVLVSLGLLFLLAACSNASTGQSASQVTSSQTASNSTRAKTIEQTSPAGLPHATPAHTSSGVTAPSPTGSSASTSASSSTSSSTANGQTASLVLTLACSGPQAQDGFHMNGSQARACVYTSPGAHLNIQVRFCGNKPDTSNALQGTFTANGSGFYEWIWKPQANCQPLSAWSTTVTAQLNGQSAVVSEGSSAQTSSQSTSQSTSHSTSQTPAHSSSHSSSSVNVPDGW
jgi:hypothetical protein